MEKVLISAFACSSNMGSEPGVGWNWIRQLSKYRDLIVLTRKYDEFGNNTKELLEKQLEKEAIINVEFFYYNLPKCFDFLLKGKLLHIYYSLWQRIMFYKVRQEIDLDSVEAIHHITYNEFRTPGYLWKLDKPFIWGPVGGGTSYPKGFDNLLGKEYLFECFRRVYNELCKKSGKLHGALKKAEQIFVADDSTYNFLPEDYKNKYVKCLETGINFSEDIKQIKYGTKSKLHILWAGRIIPLKGLPLLINALKNIRCDFHLTIVGEGGQRNYIEKLCRKLGIIEKVTFKGNIPYESIKSEYLAADLFVFTSLRDTSGNVVLEAMSHGLPVICLNHHGVKDIVTSDTGVKIDCISKEYVINEIRKQLESFSKDYELRERMGKAGRERIKKFYDWDKKGEFINKYYTRILSSKVNKEFSGGVENF